MKSLTKAIGVVISGIIGLLLGLLISPEFPVYPFFPTEEALLHIRLTEQMIMIIAGIGTGIGAFGGAILLHANSKYALVSCFITVLSYALLESLRVSSSIYLPNLIGINYAVLILVSLLVVCFAHIVGSTYLQKT